MIKKLTFILLASVLAAFAGVLLFADKSKSAISEASFEKPSPDELAKLETAYFASGCFWCVEAIFESVEGVAEAVSGYSGGENTNPTYRQVAYGKTKHAEAVKVYYDPDVVTYATLLKVFFGSHDPTTLNRQGPDRGAHYRSAIFYKDNQEEAAARAYIQELTANKTFKDPIVTQVVAFKAFYDAEAYHQDFERLNPNQPYVVSVSIPRLNKFKKKFPELLKESAKLH